MAIFKKKHTEEDITSLEPNQIIVFGSNEAGIHGAGAALTCKTLFDAEEGIGEGETGQCYALPTKDFQIRTLSLDRIKEKVKTFYRVALCYCDRFPDEEFLVTKVGCGRAGYTVEQIGKIFADIERQYADLGWDTSFIILPKEFCEQ